MPFSHIINPWVSDGHECECRGLLDGGLELVDGYNQAGNPAVDPLQKQRGVIFASIYRCERQRGGAAVQPREARCEDERREGERSENMRLAHF